MLLYIKLQSWLFFIKGEQHVKAVKFFLWGDKYNLKKYSYGRYYVRYYIEKIWIVFLSEYDDCQHS